MQALIRLLYSLLVAAAVVVFVGFGLNSLFRPPKYPAYPTYSSTYSEDKNSAYQREQKAYDQKVKEFESKDNAYNRKLAIISLPLAIIFLLAGLRNIRQSEVIGEGLALGGAATSIYAIITASMADARGVRFLAVALFLTSVLLLVRVRFPKISL